MALDAPLFFRGLLDRNPFAKIVGTIAQDDIFGLSAESRVYKWFACYPFPYHRYEMKELPITILPPSRFMEIDERARKAIEKAILQHNLKYQEVMTWTTDGFFRETKEKVMYRKSEGCAVVEMECSALAACAAFRKATWGMILYTADSLTNVEQYDERNWGGNVAEYGLALCLDAVLAL